MLISHLPSEQRPQSPRDGDPPPAGTRRGLSLAGRGTVVVPLHFVSSTQEYNEMQHLRIMESLGGDVLWSDRFLARHAAIIYYWVLILVSGPREQRACRAGVLARRRTVPVITTPGCRRLAWFAGGRRWQAR